MPNTAAALRRWLGAFSLAVASGMLIWGQTILKPHLEGAWFLLYWLLCLLFTASAVGISLLEVFAVRRELKADLAELKARTLSEVEPPGPAGKPSSTQGQVD